MKIENYTLTIIEETLFNDIYNEYKKTYPSATIQQRKNILGIGIPGYGLFFYYMLKNNTIFLKFKCSNIFYDIYTNKETIIALIKNAELIPLNSGATNKTQHTIEDIYLTSNHENPIYSELQKIPSYYDNYSFNNCSLRLKNGLNRENIYTIKDLKLYSGKIENIPWIGKKSITELSNFLQELSTTFDETIIINDLKIICDCDFITEANNYVPQNKTQLYEYLQNKDLSDFKEDSIGYILKLLMIFEHVKNNFTADKINEDIYYKYQDNYEKLNSLYLDTLNYIDNLAKEKLDDRSYKIIQMRIGLNDNDANTIQKIGDYFNLTRERIRQILKKIYKKLNINASLNEKNRYFLYEKAQYIKELKDNLPEFLIYIANENNIIFLEFFLNCILKTKETERFKNKLLNIIQSIKISEKQKITNEIFNSAFLKHIVYPETIKEITDDFFNNLIPERTITDNSESITGSFIFNNIEYQYESLLEKRILKSLLKHNTFKRIKTQSLSIDYGYGATFKYYPDIQAITHDNKFVIIEIKPLIKMCEYRNIRKFNALQNYCKNNGYGYLIMDNFKNYYDEKNKINSSFAKLLTEFFNKHKSLDYKKYKEFVNITKCTISEQLATIKMLNLRLHTNPFYVNKLH